MFRPDTSGEDGSGLRSITRGFFRVFWVAVVTVGCARCMVAAVASGGGGGGKGGGVSIGAGGAIRGALGMHIGLS
jgi:hypothetical protein